MPTNAKHIWPYWPHPVVSSSTTYFCRKKSSFLVAMVVITLVASATSGQPSTPSSSSSSLISDHQFANHSTGNQSNNSIATSLHYHHSNHRHLSSYTPKSFSKSKFSTPAYKLSTLANQLSESARKRKRELTDHTGSALWIHSSTSRRLRRLAHLYSMTAATSGTGDDSTLPNPEALISASSLPIYAKVNVKPSSSQQPRPYQSSALSAFSANNANSVNNNRLKILLNPPPPGFGAAFGAPKPNTKCNYDIYPSGCFDENGSMCDTAGSGQCICRPGFLIRTGVYCLRPTAIGEACYTTEQCERKVANSGCFNYREEYREENPSAFFGPSQSSWPMGECRCRKGHRYDVATNACVRSLIGSWCSNVWDCELVADSEDSESHTSGNHRYQQNRSHYHHDRHGSSTGNPARTKMANVICENNICNCSLHFHYNQSSEECQFVETYGSLCDPSIKRPARHLTSTTTTVAPEVVTTGGATVATVNHHHKRPIRESFDEESISCNLPTVCSENGTCVCMTGYEHQASMVPQCQPIGGHFTYYYHSGSSIRSGAKGDHVGSSVGVIGGGGVLYDRTYEGQSNVGNFVEYVLYVLVPALIVIMLFKPCFRRIGEWRNHVHHYQSDSDFYLAASANGLRPVITEMNVIGPGQCSEKGTAPATGPVTAAELLASEFASYAFGPHIACHLFEPTDPCYATPLGYGYHTTATMPLEQQQQASLALVREKLQTIEECQSEDGGGPSGPGPGYSVSFAGPCGGQVDQLHCKCDDAKQPQPEVDKNGTHDPNIDNNSRNDNNAGAATTAATTSTQNDNDNSKQTETEVEVNATNDSSGA